jgi:hypothetical protein
MPNIEIHGLGIRGIYYEDAVNLKKKIRVLFAEKPYFSDMVVEIYDSDVSDVKEDRRQPYLRVVSSSQKEINDVVAMLRQLDIDIEQPPPIKFHPRKSAIAQIKKRPTNQGRRK